MNICVLGCDFHLGPVMAAMLAELGHDIVGHSTNGDRVLDMREGIPPVSEPGLPELFAAGISAGKLRFTTSYADSVVEADVVLVAFDTPVNDLDEADPEFVIREVEETFPFLNNGQLVILSSQLPVGSCSRLERMWADFSDKRSDEPVTFAVLPENLRLGTALESFRKERWIVGTRCSTDDDTICKMLGKGTYDVVGQHVTPEEAEFAKHARNAYLATCIALGNELAVLGAKYGADASIVADCLRLDPRVGKAPISPGGPIAGGTLLRDLAYIGQLAATAGIPSTITSAVRQSNDHHKGWLRRAILEAFGGNLRYAGIDILGKSYKAGSDTDRRSYAVELMSWLEANGATVRLFEDGHPAEDSMPSAVVLYNPSLETRKRTWAEFPPVRHVFDPSGIMPHLATNHPKHKAGFYHRVGAPK